MPTVFITGRGPKRKFHRTAECRELTKKTVTGVMSVELRELDLPTPCLRCYPDAPRAESFHMKCPVHQSYFPCEHNGGVLAETPYVIHRRTICHEPGDVVIRTKYVWPEHARHYITV